MPLVPGCVQILRGFAAGGSVIALGALAGGSSAGSAGLVGGSGVASRALGDLFIGDSYPSSFE
ncbi:unnamed protein product [Urochloa humidicola]